MAKNCTEYKLPDCLADWIDKVMPKLGGVRKIKIYCCKKLPYDWWDDEKWGISLDETVYLRKSSCGDECDYDFIEKLLHELAHVRQWQRHQWSFKLRYLWRHVWRYIWRWGRKSHPDEKHAKTRAKILRAISQPAQ